jgi:hypothetical protein
MKGQLTAGKQARAVLRILSRILSRSQADHGVVAALAPGLAWL